MAQNPQKIVVYPRMMRKGPFTVDAPGSEPKKGETAIKRNIAAKDGLFTSPEPAAIKTIWDIVEYAAKKHGNANAIGTRKVIDTHTETKKVKKIVDGTETEVDKKWTYFELSGYSFKSYVEYRQLTIDAGSALRTLGLGKGDKVHAYGSTSMNWLTVAHGIFSQSMVLVTAYDTLGEGGLRASLQQTESKAIFLDASLLPTFNNVLKDTPSIQFVITNNESKPKQEELDKIKNNFPNVRVLTFDELKELGAKNPAEPVPPASTDLATIMYTSGTSGTPKGVTLRHSHIIASAAGIKSAVYEVLSPPDCILAYLPQAHILEFVVENACMYLGITLGYGSPKTLTDASVRNCKGDIAELRPTIMIGVPAVWESVRKGITAKVGAGGFIAQKVFWGALAAKKALMSANLPGVKLLDMLVFNKVKAATGGRLRFVMSGGSPIGKETQMFISHTIAPLISGYGLTETNGMGALNYPLEWNPGSNGPPPTCIEVKLVDFPDAGYFAEKGQGELWIRGPAVMEGYYGSEEDTKQALNDEGWFMTGDIAEFDSFGHLRIIDRKKNLVKTLNGEYIALEKLESIYRMSPLVADICVYATGEHARPIAIVVPLEPALLKLTKSNGIEGHGLEDLVHNKKVNDLVLKELQDTGRQNGLNGTEILDGLVLDSDEWTPQSGLKTAAQKIKRKDIQEKHMANIKKVYGQK